MNSVKLTEGSIFKRLMLFALPMMAGNLLQQIYNIADSIIVGRFINADALAAVGSAYTLMTFLTSIIIGLCMGSGALFSKAFGAGEITEMKRDIWMSFVFIGAVTVILYLLVYPGTDLILHLLAIPQQIYAIMRTYVTIIFIGLGFTFLYNFFAYLLRSIGNSVVPLVFLSLSSVLNIGLDLYFVISLHQGVAGAAAATVIAQAFAGVGISSYVICTHRDLLFGDVKWQWKRMQYIIKNDIFTALQQSVMNLGILMVQGLVNSFGTTIMAAFTAAVKIDTLAYMPAQEFGNAYSLFISQNYGAKKSERIQKGTRIAMLTSAFFCIVISVIVWICAKPFMQIFVQKSQQNIILEGIKYLRIEGTFYVGIGILFLLYGYYRGIQNAEMSLILTIISLGTRVLLSYLLAPHVFGVCAIWASIPIGWFLADAIGLAYYKKKRSKLCV